MISVRASGDWKPADGVVLDKLSMAAVKRATSSSIVAGPGAGKTELLAQRASFLLETGACRPPGRILAISFKRDAAKNLRDRVVARVGEDLARRFESYTFDAFAKSIVDRFSATLPKWCRPSQDYAVSLPNWRDWKDFAERLQEGGLSVSSRRLELGHATLTREVGPLPATADKALLVNKAGLSWWAHEYKQKPPRLTFGMISTLAMTILRHNPQVLDALRLTYSHVFLDEFQDTTSLQYGLLREAFLGSQAVITAVGDSKQRIMTFAGARSGIFEEFAADFDADVVALTSNFRSNRRIVEIVNAMALQIEPKAVPVVCARPDGELPDPTDGVLAFSSPAQEAAELAETIAEGIREDGLGAEDFMLLVRQTADKAEKVLAPAFAAQGLTLRNEARMLEGVQIQELMTEPLADLVIGVLQMAADDRFNAPFQRVRGLIGPVYGDNDDRPVSEMRVERAIRDAVRIARDGIALSPEDTEVEALVMAILDVFGDRLLAQLSPDYARQARLDEVRSSIGSLLAECCAVVDTWGEAIHQFLGRDQVKLMTVHKSKGLEAHTVLFLHLQDDGFHWEADMDEERLAFFVAASRARERFFVTTTNTHRDKVEPLWDMVAAAGLNDL